MNYPKYSLFQQEQMTKRCDHATKLEAIGEECTNLLSFSFQSFHVECGIFKMQTNMITHSLFRMTIYHTSS